MRSGPLGNGRQIGVQDVHNRPKIFYLLYFYTINEKVRREKTKNNALFYIGVLYFHLANLIFNNLNIY
jgi:hypothetical protein